MSSSQSSLSSDGQSTAHERDGREDLPQLDTLISHLVAAKRSLSSISHVWRANEIVTAARSTVEETVILSARTGFLRRGLNSQLRFLYSVRAEAQEISLRGKAEFTSVLKNLDAADARLKKTLDTLRETIVHASFRPEDEEPKSLHDFVDERGVDDLLTALKSSIDRTSDAQAELDASNYAFDGELHLIKKALGHYRATTKFASSRSSTWSSSSSSGSNSELASLSSIPAMLRSLETHAQEMANLLESLVRHFDLCVTAVKLTEGGGAAARSITGDIPDGVSVSRRAIINGEDLKSDTNMPVDPASDTEYREMVGVLVKDAAEADDVVMEIQDRNGDMESVFESILTQRDILRSIYNATVDVFQQLSILSSEHLPGYIDQGRKFIRTWREEQDHINGGLSDLSDLHNLYIGFLDAYDGLILEVSRRKYVRLRVEKVLRDVRQKLDQLYEEDVNAREAFRIEQGDYLPSDIWPGVSREPMRIEFLRVAGGNLKGVPDQSEDGNRPGAEGRPRTATAYDSTEEGEVIPDLPSETVEHALARLRVRSGRSL